MGSQSNAIAEHIREEREQLGRDLDELQSIVREQPKRWVDENLPRFLGITFGAFFLIGLLGADRRVRGY
jgi:hypothetical protein